MKKIKNLLKGSPVAMVVIGLIVAGVASAALVNYLSNEVVATVEITSPIHMNINEGNDTGANRNTSIAINTYGGDDFEFTTVASNRSSNVVTGYRVITLVSPTVFTGYEIAKIQMAWGNDTNGDVMTDITGHISIVNPLNVNVLTSVLTWTGSSKRLVFTNGETTDIAAGDSEWNTFILTTNQGIEAGAYEITSKFVLDLAEYATYQYNR